MKTIQNKISDDKCIVGLSLFVEALISSPQFPRTDHLSKTIKKKIEAYVSEHKIL